MTAPIIKTCPCCGQTYTLGQWAASAPQRFSCAGMVLELVVCTGINSRGERCTDGLVITISEPDEDERRAA